MTERNGVTQPAALPQQILLYTCTFTAGAAVMIYEFMIVRVLTPHFGGDLSIWSSVISVCLAALALGYFTGGKLADRYGSLRILSLGLAAGGAAGFLIAPLARLAGEISLMTDVALRWHSLPGALLAGFLPVFALGTVLPQAICIRNLSDGRVGSSAGAMSAISTLGSILGTLGTVMMLLPSLGAMAILNGVSAALLLIGLLGFFGGRARVLPVVALMLLAPHASAQVRFQTYSAYHHIIVQDEGSTRVLYFDQAPQSLMDLRDPQRGGFGYTLYFHVPLVFKPDIQRVLYVGLGGGTGPKSFLANYPAMEVDVAEIDPVVVDVARRFFHVPVDPRLNIQVGDGRMVLQRARGRYGAIIMDAYATGPSGAYLPYHLATKEFFEMAWDRLENGGSIVYNTIGHFPSDEVDVLKHLQVTLESVFQIVYAFESRDSINTVFVAQKEEQVPAPEPGPDAGEPTEVEESPVWPDVPFFGHSLNSLEMRELALRMPAEFLEKLPGFPDALTAYSAINTAPRIGQVLTDDFAPVDLAPGRRPGG